MKYVQECFRNRFVIFLGGEWAKFYFKAKKSLNQFYPGDLVSGRAGDWCRIDWEAPVLREGVDITFESALKKVIRLKNMLKTQIVKQEPPNKNTYSLSFNGRLKSALDTCVFCFS